MMFAAVPRIAFAIDPPHPTNDCAQCHITHGAPGGNITAVAGNVNLCLSCHMSGGSASAKAYATVDQAKAWPGIGTVSSGGTSHRWDAGPAGYVIYYGGASTASSGTVSSAGVFTGAYAKTYTVTIASSGAVGTALFNWSATAPGGGGTNVPSAPSVLLNEGISAVFTTATNGGIFRSNDVWRIFVRPDVIFPTNATLASQMTNGIMSCSVCHNEHSQASPPFDRNAPAYGGAGTGQGRHFMIMTNTECEMCAGCHAPRAVTNSLFGSHPVGIRIPADLFHRNPTNLPFGQTTSNMLCLTCHQVHNSSSTDGALLRMTNRNDLCTACHTLADTATPGTHMNATNSRVLWPGGQYGSTLPARTNAFERGTCINCHAPHGWPDATNTAVKYPVLLADREENVCFTCHDGNGPSQYNLFSVFQKAAIHPVSRTGMHTVGETNPGAFGVTNRHAECVDCHNPHQLKNGFAASGASMRLAGVSRVVVTNGGAGTKPTYGFVTESDTNAPFADYQVCFKCHSGWTTLPAGSKDMSVIFNPSNQSAHPVEAPGRNTNTFMIASLTNGTGLPHLTITSLVTCADCHNNDQIPLTISLVSSYTGLIVRGPHGAVSNASMSGSILRGSYRLTQSATYSATNFSVCFVCHSPAPFPSSSTTQRNDTRFNWHGYHMVTEHAACVDCHSDTHGTKLASVAGNTNYTRLVSFGPAVTGTRTWNTTATGGNCTLTCHGQGHSGNSYP
jgi:predicted CXXCH cytochrome family protein